MEDIEYIRNGGYRYDIFDTIVEYAAYEEYIEHIQSLFKDVFVYNYDQDLKKENKPDFIKRLCDFIGEPVPNYQDKRYRVRFMGKVVRELINAVSNSRMQAIK